MERRRLRFIKSLRQYLNAELLFTKYYNTVVRVLGKTNPLMDNRRITQRYTI